MPPRNVPFPLKKGANRFEADKSEVMMTDRMLKFFKFDHLPRHLQAVSQPFHELATKVLETCPQSAERTVALRKLLEAKDAAVRSVAIPEEAP
jgi:hypothetical protein